MNEKLMTCRLVGGEEGVLGGGRRQHGRTELVVG